jgi:hypothetical protein
MSVKGKGGLPRRSASGTAASNHAVAEARGKARGVADAIAAVSRGRDNSTIIKLPDGSTMNLIGITRIDGTLLKGPAR